MGVRQEQPDVMHLALDRMLAVDQADDIAYRSNADLTPDAYYHHVIGVTVDRTRPCNVQIWVSAEHAPYVETKPLHHSQRILERRDDGIIIELCVQLNFELEREILGFGDGMTVLTPARLRQRIRRKLGNAAGRYESE